MKINLNLLPIELNDDMDIPKSFYESTDILDIRNIHVKGKIYYNLSDEVEINVHVKGIIVLKDSITLDNIDYPIDINIVENLENLTSESKYFYEKSKNTLDIIEFLWENIVLEVPISVTKATGINLKGEGWELNKEENEDLDPRFSKLKDIFKGGE